MNELEVQEDFYLVYLGMNFDVNKAKKIVNYPYNKVDANVPLSSLIHALEGTTLNKRYAMSKKADLSKPLLMGTMGYMHFVFDGHHRIYKASKIGRKTLPAYILTPEETRDIVKPKKLFDKLNESLPTPVGISNKIKRKYYIG